MESRLVHPSPARKLERHPRFSRANRLAPQRPKPNPSKPKGPQDPRRRPASRAITPLSAVVFAASFAAGVGTATVVRQCQGGSGGNASPGIASSGSGRTGAAGHLPGHPYRDAEGAERVFQEGVALLSAERSAEALEKFVRAAALDPTDPRPHHGSGKIYTQLFLKDKAEECFREALRADPGFRPSKESLVMILYEKSRHAEAMAILGDLEKETPGEPFVLGELAINALALGNHGEAIALLEKYRAAKPEDAWGRAHLGKAHADAGRLREAEAEYREALSLDGSFQIAHYWLAQLLVASKREAEAQPYLERYRRLRQLATDEQQLKMALLKKPEDLGALVGLARVQLLLGKIQDSRAALDRALQVAPTDPRVIELEQIHAKGPRPRPVPRGK
ncbi:MAG TPA: tetratricopeptide repeat protein [Planctomycetota bacterium]|nr:tetratricopeptide repeat protein [Planctomycetota bacterium]